MTFVARFLGIAVAVREFLAPSYRPERHYMRGPGPASNRNKPAPPVKAPEAKRQARAY